MNNFKNDQTVIQTHNLSQDFETKYIDSDHKEYLNIAKKLGNDAADVSFFYCDLKDLKDLFGTHWDQDSGFGMWYLRSKQYESYVQIIPNHEHGGYPYEWLIISDNSHGVEILQDILGDEARKFNLILTKKEWGVL